MDVILFTPVFLNQIFMGGCCKSEGKGAEAEEKGCCGGGECGEGGCGGCGGEGGCKEGGCEGQEKVHGPDVLEYGDYEIKLFYNGEFCMIVNEDGSLVKKGEVNSGKTLTSVSCVAYLSQAEEYGAAPEVIVFLSKELEKRYGIMRTIMQVRAEELDAQLSEWQSMFGDIIRRTLGLRDEEEEVLVGDEFPVLDEQTTDLALEELANEINGVEVEEEGNDHDDSVELAKTAIMDSLEKK